MAEVDPMITVEYNIQEFRAIPDHLRSELLTTYQETMAAQGSLEEREDVV